MVKYHPAVVQRVAAIIAARHMPREEIERQNAEGWDLGPDERATLDADELDKASAVAMLMRAGIDPRALDRGE